jgi:hypothetical protein
MTKQNITIVSGLQEVVYTNTKKHIPDNKPLYYNGNYIGTLDDLQNHPFAIGNSMVYPVDSDKPLGSVDELKNSLQIDDDGVINDNIPNVYKRQNIKIFITLKNGLQEVVYKDNNMKKIPNDKPLYYNNETIGTLTGIKSASNGNDVYSAVTKEKIGTVCELENSLQIEHDGSVIKGGKRKSRSNQKSKKRRKSRINRRRSNSRR